ncbi:MAG: HAMP domain-containing histidine kinase [Hellea sp.]|nr:HAMP domain-containing histidine kinase [Hellea sp.]
MLKAFSKLYRNTLFRLSLLGAVLFVVSLFVSLGYVYYATVVEDTRRVENTLRAEVADLQALYDNEGLSQVQTEMFLRVTSGEGMYLLDTYNGQVGNIPEKNFSEESMRTFEQIDAEPGGPFVKLEFSYDEDTEDVEDLQDRRVLALAGFIVDNENNPVAGLIVGRDVEATRRTGDRIWRALVISALIALILGLLSSFFVSRRFTRRIDAFNRLATDVRSGQLDRRAPRNYSEDELDLLAEHLNAMLDHIDRLMKAMRYAGDSIAHDLRSPLTRLRTRLESTAQEIKDDNMSDILWSAAEDADQLLSTFDKVLRIARLEAGEQREMLQEVNPKTVLEDMAEFYEPACEDAQLDFESKIKDGLLILADRGLLSQAVSNLVENAIKYTPAGGKIRLVLDRNSNGRVRVAVMDNGPGIPAPDRERVKERFVRLDKSRTAPGSGLGLAMVDAIATLHEAEFKLSDGLPNDNGVGLSVEIIFPRRRHLRPQMRDKLKS